MVAGGVVSSSWPANVTTGARLAAVVHDGVQRGYHLLGEPAHGRLVVDPVAVVPGELQRVVFDPAHHVERSAGCRAIIFRTMASNPSGASGRCSRTLGTLPVRRAAIFSAMLAPGNGGLPVTKKNKVQPIP